MLYGDRIINGILSLIYLEPCHSPRIPLKQEEAYRALIIDLVGTHSQVSTLPFKMIFRTRWCQILTYFPGLIRYNALVPLPLFRGSCHYGIALYLLEPSNGKYRLFLKFGWDKYVISFSLFSLCPFSLSFYQLGTDLVKHYRTFFNRSLLVFVYLFRVDTVVTDS